MTPARAATGIAVGFVAGVLSGSFGVGGGIVMVPAVRLLLSPIPIVAIATPLPVIFPTALVGAATYRSAGQVSFRAATWAAGPGAVGAATGAALTSVIDAHALLLVTATLIVWQAIRVARGGEYPTRPRGSTPGWQYALLGLGAGLVSGLLGVGGGIVMVPVLTTVLGMPLKRALGTSLVIITALVVPGTIVHSVLGHVDWAIFAVLAIGVLPGARIGAKFALGARERTLRLAVATLLFLVAIAYAVKEIADLAA